MFFIKQAGISWRSADICCEQMLCAYLKGVFIFTRVTCWMSLANCKLLIFGPIFTGQIFICPVCNFSCNLIAKYDYMSIFWTLVTKVTSAQLFMQKNAWHWDLREKIEFNMNSIWSLLMKMSSTVSAVKSQDIDVISIHYL